jgi:hypothetical protein
MTLYQYFELEKKAKEPFWKNEKGYIYIPINSFMACLANANDEAPARLRIDNLRSAIIATDFITEKKKPDGNFERFAVVKSGSGQTLSNQRGLRVNAYISNFKAKGELQFDLELVSPEAIKNLIEFAGRVIGIGGSRKLGWGRFTFTAT